MKTTDLVLSAHQLALISSGPGSWYVKYQISTWRDASNPSLSANQMLPALHTCIDPIHGSHNEMK